MVASSIREVFDMEEAITNVKGLLMRYLQPEERAAARAKAGSTGSKRKLGLVERKGEKRRA